MKIIAKDQNEFEEMVKLSKYLHDSDLDLDKYPLLNLLAHLYRIKHAASEGSNEEQKCLEEIFYVEDSP